MFDEDEKLDFLSVFAIIMTKCGKTLHRESLIG